MNDAEVEADKTYRELEATVGAAMLAYNDLAHEIFLIFRTLTKMTHGRAEIVFFSIKSDKQQRDLVRALAKVELASEEALLDGLKKALDAVESIAKIRNDAAHSIWGYEFSEEGENLSSVVKLRTGEAAGPFIEQYKKVKDDSVDTFGRLNAVRRLLLARAA